jgi:hypothetical protein
MNDTGHRFSPVRRCIQGTGRRRCDEIHQEETTMIQMALVLAAMVMPATAGEIFGDVRLGDKYVAQAPIRMVCGTDTVRNKTDDAGSFRLATKA